MVEKKMTFSFFLHSRVQRAKIVSRKKKEVSIVGDPVECEFLDDMKRSKEKIDTMAKLIAYTVGKYGDRHALGTREVLSENEERQEDGKTMTKLTLGEYHWLKYNDVETLTDQFGRGIREIGVEPRQNICIFADTRAEWLIAALGCFKNRFKKKH